jgi:methyltransferase family protein
MALLGLADLVFKLRTSRGAIPDAAEFRQSAEARALHGSLRKYLPLAGFCGASLDLLAALAGTDKYGAHMYTPVYAALTAAQRRNPVSLLEIGIGGFGGRLGGESLLMWAAYFRKGRIYGIDIVDKTALTAGRIKVFQCSQTDRERLTALAREIGPFDFVIDDGSHVNEHQIETFGILWPFVKDGGVYIVEDVQTSYWPSYGGGVLGTPEHGSSCMSFFKTLVDSVNLPEFLAPPPPGAGLQDTIGSIAFHHNLIVLTKDRSLRTSNLDLEALRPTLLRPPEGAGR